MVNLSLCKHCKEEEEVYGGLCNDCSDELCDQPCCKDPFDVEKLAIIMLGAGVIIALMIFLYNFLQPSGLVIGQEHMTQAQTQYFEAALNKGCKNGRIILITPYYSKYAGQAFPPVAIKIYSIWQWTPLELYCIVRHECNHGIGGEHTWDYVWEECYNETVSTL